MARSGGHGRGRPVGCTCAPHGWLMGAVASLWVSAYHAVASGSMSVEQESAEIRMSLIQQDLTSCAARLEARESELEARVRALTLDAGARKQRGDIQGAKKRLVDRKRVQAQLDRLAASMSVIDLHMNTIEGTELNRSVLETLRASGDALRRLGASGGGIEEVERIVSDVEHQVEAASEISRVIHTANVAGTVNTMGHDFMTDEELEEELSALLSDGDGEHSKGGHEAGYEEADWGLSMAPQPPAPLRRRDQPREPAITPGPRVDELPSPRAHAQAPAVDAPDTHNPGNHQRHAAAPVQGGGGVYSRMLASAQ